ncbi:hypothetical protein CP10881SC42_0436 [Chlamydia avium]|uniref:Uncharacterized protein n=1 Tax=Chlamydia avium TaxID=1457141 RepID=A0ABN0MT95_9CHLA|nr:hypothetical protein CP10881SC42_0436 [Chlamydia avium]
MELTLLQNVLFPSAGVFHILSSEESDLPYGSSINVIYPFLQSMGLY